MSSRTSRKGSSSSCVAVCRCSGSPTQLAMKRAASSSTTCGRAGEGRQGSATTASQSASQPASHQPTNTTDTSRAVLHHRLASSGAHTRVCRSAYEACLKAPTPTGLYEVCCLHVCKPATHGHAATHYAVAVTMQLYVARPAVAPRNCNHSMGPCTYTCACQQVAVAASTAAAAATGPPLLTRTCCSNCGTSTQCCGSSCFSVNSSSMHRPNANMSLRTS